MPKSKTKLHKAVVVMFNPKKTIGLYNWWMKYGFWDGYCQYRDSSDSKKYERMFPQLKNAYTGELIEPLATLRLQIADPLIAVASKKGRKAFEKVTMEGPHFALRGGEGPSIDELGSTQDGGFAYVLMGYDRMEVLSWFPDKLWSLIATWQVLLPSQKEHDPCDLRRMLALGFFPESDEATWLAHYGSLRVSSNVSAGMGILTNPPIAWTSEGWIGISKNHLFAKEQNFVLSTAR
jgi:hypothetical protein